MGCLAGNTAAVYEWLMDHDSRIRQGKAPPLCPRRKDHGTEGHSHSHTDRGNGALYELHGIINSQSCCYHAARRINVKIDIFTVILRIQIQHLCNKHVCGIRSEFTVVATYEDDAIHQKAGIDIKNPFYPADFTYYRSSEQDPCS